MIGSEQVNVRVPSNGRDLILRLARLMREDSRFSAKLERFLDDIEDKTATPLLGERIEQIERRLLTIETKTGISTPPPTPRRTPHENLFGEADGPDPIWTTGEGRGRRLSHEGEKELERRIIAGEDNNTISKAMGLKVFAIQNRRDKIEKEMGLRDHIR